MRGRFWIHIAKSWLAVNPSPPPPCSLSTLLLPGCTLNRQDVRLTLHYEKGFTVTREPADPAGGAVLFRYPYEKLKMSADDGIRNLYLDFGGPEGEMVSPVMEWIRANELTAHDGRSEDSRRLDPLRQKFPVLSLSLSTETFVTWSHGAHNKFLVFLGLTVTAEENQTFLSSGRIYSQWVLSGSVRVRSG